MALKRVYGNNIDLQSAMKILGYKDYAYFNVEGLDLSTLNLTSNDIVLGGTSIVPDQYLGGATRLAGADRYATSAQIQEYANTHASTGDSSYSNSVSNIPTQDEFSRAGKYHITPPNSGSFYIINLIDYSAMSLNSLPESISENVASRFEEVSISGRSASYYGYSGTETPGFSFSIKIHDDYCPQGIVKTVDFYKSLTYPAYTGRIVAPNCKVCLGTLVQFFAICESVDVTWNLPLRDGIYTNADINFSFKRIFRVAPSYNDIKNRSAL